MSRALRFIVVLVAGLGLLTWAALLIVNSTTRSWFEKDVALRSDLAVNGSRRALLADYQQEDWVALRELLGDITRDERIMAAGACTAEHRLVATTQDYPSEFSCARLGAHVTPEQGGEPASWHGWREVAELPGGIVQVSAFPLAHEAQLLGFVVLVHDLKDRMRAMRAYLAEFNVYRWAGRMLVDAARLRSRERLTGRLSERQIGMEGAA